MWLIISFVIVILRPFGKTPEIFMIYAFIVVAGIIVIGRYYRISLEENLFKKFESWEKMYAYIKRYYGYDNVPSKYDKEKIRWFVNTTFNFGDPELNRIKLIVKKFIVIQCIIPFVTALMIIVFER